MLRHIFTQFLILTLLSLSSVGQAQSLCGALFQPHSSESIQNQEISVQNKEIANFYEGLQKDATWLQSHQLFWNQYKVFTNFSKQLKDFETSASGFPRNYAEVLVELIHNPRKPLTTEQILQLNADQKKRHFTKLVLQVAALTELNARLVQRSFHYLRGQEVVPTSKVGSALATSATRFITQLYYLVLPKSWQTEIPSSTSQEIRTSPIAPAQIASWATQKIYNGPLRYLLAVVPLAKIMSPTEKIFERQLRDSKHQLSKQEVELLKQTNAFEDYQTNQSFKDQTKTLQAFRRWGSRAFVVAFAAHMTFVANWAVHLTKPGAVLPVQEFLAKPEHRLQNNQVRIYNESVPFPHMAIEIDGKVYSYGQTHLEVKTSQEYLMIAKIRALANEKVRLGPSAEKKPEAESSVDLSKALHWTGLDQLPRSVQMVTLNLNSVQKNQLKRNLELSTFSRYQNHTFAMDCATMVVKALSESTETPLPFFRQWPIPVDASPSVMMMYFGMLKTLQVKNSDQQLLVGSIGQVAIERASEVRMHQLRNLYINAMESRLFLTFFSWDVAIRGYVNIRYGVDNFQALDPEVRQGLIDQKEKQVAELVNPDSGQLLAQKYSVFLDSAKILGSTPENQRNAAWVQQKKDLLEVTTYTLHKEVLETRENFFSPDTAFQDLLYAGYKLDLLQQMKTQISAAVEGREASVLGNPNMMGKVSAPKEPSTQVGLFERILKEARSWNQ